MSKYHVLLVADLSKPKMYVAGVEGLVTAKEDRMIGKVSCKTYWAFFRAGASLLTILSLSLLSLLPEGIPSSPCNSTLVILMLAVASYFLDRACFSF